ncbi:MAG: IS21 family transposase [Acidimicrobiales bacterium]
MRKVRDVVRLAAAGLSIRQVAAAVGAPHTTVADHLRRAAAAGVGWPLPEGMSDADLEAALFKKEPAPPAETRPLPEWDYVHRELRRPGVTLMLVWLEYKSAHPADGYSYSQFCHHYRGFQGRLDLVMRQEHRAGQKFFVDFPGDHLPIYDRASGEVALKAELFVGVMGASSFVCAEAVAGQDRASWITAHVHAFEAMGCLPEIVVPDNLAAAVTKAHRYEPEINASYAEMAAHYQLAVIPARAGKPRDKAKAEAGVLLAERWILARLRNRRFYSLSEANAAVADCVAWINDRPFKKMAGSRRSVFEQLERPVMRPLPATRYEYGAWRLGLKVNIDYHIDADRHYYSVPYQLVGQRVDVRSSAATVEIFHSAKRVASHLRSRAAGRHTTDPAHMPDSHRRHAEWTPSRIIEWARKTGPATASLCEAIMEARRHPEQGYRSCLGIIRLADRYGTERLEAAAARALAARALSYRSVESILSHGLDAQPLGEKPTPRAHRRHHNLRGPEYYR